MYSANHDWWSGLKPGYGPGVLQGRTTYLLTPNCDPNSNGDGGRLLTRLTFTAPDGTEYELRDQATGGRPIDVAPCVQWGGNRGQIFTTADGTAARFLSDTTIYDNAWAQGEYSSFYPSGYLILKDGVRYRIDSGLVKWMRDRNGNKLTFSYDNYAQPYGPANRVISIIDSLNRKVTISYDVQDTQPFGLCDKIEYRGFAGAVRTIRLSKTNLGNALRSDFTLKTNYQLFPEFNGSCSTCTFNPTVTSAVWLPDGRSYAFSYDSYAELTRVKLPTGGAFEYDYAAGLTNGPLSGAWLKGFAASSSQADSLYRRVVEKRTYIDDNIVLSKTRFSRPESIYTCGADVCVQTEGFVAAEDLDANGALLAKAKHYYFGNAAEVKDDCATGYSPWQVGREFKTESIGSDGISVLRRFTQTWEQRTSIPWWNSFCSAFPEKQPANDTRITESQTELNDTTPALVSKQTSINPNDPNDRGFDQYNNPTDVWEYDYGTGVPGALIRHTHTNFISATNYTDAVNGASLLSLPSQTSVYDAGGVERARTTFEYDNYNNDTNHAGLVYRSGISGFDSSFSTSFLTRGNVTAITHYLLVSGSVTGSVTAYAQYDIAGNAVKAIDARGYATTFDFADNFGSPDAEAQSNTAPIELSSAGQTSYAFARSVTNALGQTAYAQFDFYTGRPVNGEDVNGVVSSGFYNDQLDRPTQIIRATNQDVTVKSQTSFTYDDVNHVVTTTTDLNGFNDLYPLKSQAVYDGLGRTTEKRQYENSTNYIAVQTRYDSLGRAYKTSNPFRPWNSENPVWTTTGFDALGRVISVTTPDSAVVNAAYSGNRVLVADQTSRKRLSVTDGLGRLKEVWEVTTTDPATESVSFPGYGDVTAGYVTRYDYDTLDDLTNVSQRIATNGTTQSRSFVYDSLKRLTSAANPESGTVCYGTVVNSQCQSNGYDANGNLVYKTDARGILTSYVYDALNRNTSITYTNDPANTPSVTRTYDNPTTGAYGKGRLWSTQASASTLVTIDSYDALGRTKSQKQQFYYNNAWSQPYSVSGITYDLAGHVTSITYPSQHTVNYNYDGAGRLADKDAQNLAFTGTLGDGAPRTYSTGITYSPFGGLQQEQLGMQVALYHKLHYNVRGQLFDIRVSSLSLTANEWDWNRGAVVNYYNSNYTWGGSGLDNNGNLSRQQHFIPTDDTLNNYSYTQDTYSYDSLNRLASATEVHGGPSWQSGTDYVQTYDYDRWGNRTINPASSGVNNMQFDKADAQNTNRLYAPGDTSLPMNQRQMQYDSGGNLTRDSYTSTGSRTYDAENRMTSAQSSPYWSYYTYDGNGYRVRRNVNNQETWQIYGLGGELIAEYAASGSPLFPQREYGYRNGQLLVTTESGTNNALGPSALTATPPTSGAGITLNWTAASGATNYRVERATSKDGPYVFAGHSSSTTLIDSGVSGTAYLYKVCAANSQDICTSGYSNIALGVAVIFTDPDIKGFADDPSGQTVTMIKAAHITELRTTINAVRHLAGMGDGVWTYNPLALQINVEDVRDLRTNLDTALTQLGIPTPPYATDPTLKGWHEDPLNATPIRAAHIRELRTRATIGQGGSGGSGSSFQIHWLVADQLGTPRMIFDQTGSLANASRHDYLPFGEELGVNVGGRTQAQGYGQVDGIRQQFTGQQRDNETSLDYFNARYYSSIQGRFTSPDIFGSRRRNPQSWNRYSYVLNNPLKYTDPLGLQAQDPEHVKISPEDIIKIFTNEKKRSLLGRIFGKIGSLFKGGSRTQAEGDEGEEGKPEETREEERKADEKDLNERSPWRDPNAVPPVPIDESVIAPGANDPSKAIDMEEASLTPSLNGDTPREQLRDALNRVASMEGSPEAKAEMFARYGAQIRVRSDFTWGFGNSRGTDGSHIFIGGQGEVLVISPQGQLFRGSVQAGGITFGPSGPTPVYGNLKPR